MVTWLTVMVLLLLCAVYFLLGAVSRLIDRIEDIEERIK